VGVNRRAQCGRSSTCCINKSANITMRFCRRCSAGSLGESSLDFESMVEEVRRFVARMPPADSTTGSGCCPWSFSALGDQRAEILPVQRPPALAVGGRCMMRLTRILMFPFFLSASWISSPYARGAFQNAQRTFLGNFHWRLHALNRPVNLV